MASERFSPDIHCPSHILAASYVFRSLLNPNILNFKALKDLFRYINS